MPHSYSVHPAPVWCLVHINPLAAGRARISVLRLQRRGKDARLQLHNSRTRVASTERNGPYDDEQV